MSDSAATAEQTEPDQAIAAPKHPWWALAALLIGLSIIVIDTSVVNVLLPDMVDDLGLTQTDTQWVNSIYSLLFASLLITIGLTSDKYGRRLLFLLGILVFTIGSIASGSAMDSGFLIGARAVQAIGAAMMLPSSIAVINVLFTGHKRAVAFGLWGAVFGGAAALGPLLGGWLAQDFSWRWAFYINIPIAIAAAIGVLKFVPETKVAGVRGIDFPGVLMSSVGLGLIVFGLIEGQDYGWWIAIADFTVGPVNIAIGSLSVIVYCFAIGILLLLALVFWEWHCNRIGRTSLIDLSLFKIRRYGFGNVVAMIVALGEFGVLFILPLWLQSVAGLDPLETGALIAFLAVGTFIAGGSARHISARFGPTQVIRIGMVLEMGGVVGVSVLISMTRSPWWLVLPLIIYGLGLGFASAQITNVVLSDVPPTKSGQASAMTSTFRQVGAALGSAVVGAVLFTSLSTGLTRDLEGINYLNESQKTQIVDVVTTTAGQAIVPMEQKPELTAVVQDAKLAYTEAAKLTAYVASLLIFLGLLTSLGLPRDIIRPAAPPESDGSEQKDAEPEPV